MTPEELKQLKPGDDIFIRSKYVRVLNCGGVYFSHFSNEGSAYGHTLPSNVILPPPAPKYDPCRLFKKGDVVKIRSVFGRKIYIDDVLYEVLWNESCNKISIKKLTSDEILVGMSSVFFELVAPVEELEPHSVGESSDYFSVEKDDAELCLYWKDKHPNPKAAAEAECARLNAEYRKEGI